MTDSPQRPRWKRKRWLAAGLLWLAIAYPVGSGPAHYAVLRDWLPVDALTVFRPLSLLPEGPAGRAYLAYLDWWYARAAADAPIFVQPPEPG